MTGPIPISHNGPQTEDELLSLAVNLLHDLNMVHDVETREEMLNLALQIAFHGGRASAFELVAKAQREVLSAASAR